MTARAASSVPSDSSVTRWPACSRSRYDGAGSSKEGTELLGLHQPLLSEVAPRDTRREAGIPLDTRARPRLATRSDHVDSDGAQPLRGSVDRGGEPGRATAHDHEIHAPLRHVGDSQPEVLGESARTGAPQDFPEEITTGMSGSARSLDLLKQ